MWPSEKKFANLLTEQGRKWEFHPKPFKLKNTYYEPDFFLPDEKLYIEVVGTRSSFYQRRKTLKLMKKYYPDINIIIVNLKGEKFLDKNFLHLLPKDNMISLKLKPELKHQLKELSIIDGRSQTFHIEKALFNYFKAKKLLID